MVDCTQDVILADERWTVNLRLVENTVDTDGGQRCHPKLTYFNFLPSAMTEFTTRRDVAPKHEEKTWANCSPLDDNLKFQGI